VLEKQLALPEGAGMPVISAWSLKVNGVRFLVFHDGGQVLAYRLEGGNV
jgi:hypothetical protein